MVLYEIECFNNNVFNNSTDGRFSTVMTNAMSSGSGITLLHKLSIETISAFF